MGIVIEDSHKLNKVGFRMFEDDWSFILHYDVIEYDRDNIPTAREVIIETQYPPEEAVKMLRKELEIDAINISKEDIEILIILQKNSLI